MKKILLTLAAAILVCAPVAYAERLTDKDLVKLIETIASDEDRFRDALDPALKRSIIKGPGGEYDVDRVLKDFSDAAERLEDRYDEDYNANAEATDLLRQGTAIDTYFRRDQVATKGESEWNAFATQLKALATAYGTTFPLPPAVTARRVGDKQVMAAAEALERDVDRLDEAVEDGLEANPSIPKPTRDGIVREIEMIEKDAKALRSAVDDGRPASAEATQLLSRLGKVNDFLGSTPVAAASPIMAVVNGRAEVVAQAFGLPPVAAPSR